MRGAAAVMLVCAGCGRFAFDDVSARADASANSDTAVAIDAAPTPVQIVDALPCETDIALRGLPLTDSLQWVASGNTLAIAATLHIDNTHHEIHFYPLALGSGGVASPSDSTPFTTSDMYGLSVLPVDTGYVMAFTDLFDSQVHLLALDAAFATQSNTTLTGMAYTVHSLARSTAGARVVGTTPNGVGIMKLDATYHAVGTPVDVAFGSFGEPSIASVGADFIVGWDAPSGCEFERISADGVVLAGPVTLAPPSSTSCSQPVALAASGGVVYAATDRTSPATPIAYAAAGDEAFTTITSPVAIGATDSVALGTLEDGAHALVVVRTNGDSRVVDVATNGNASPLGADFGLAGTDADTEALVTVGTSLVHARTEAGMLQIRKLCR